MKGERGSVVGSTRMCIESRGLDLVVSPETETHHGSFGCSVSSDGGKGVFRWWVKHAAGVWEIGPPKGGSTSDTSKWSLERWLAAEHRVKSSTACRENKPELASTTVSEHYGSRQRPEPGPPEVRASMNIPLVESSFIFPGRWIEPARSPEMVSQRNTKSAGQCAS